MPKVSKKTGFLKANGEKFVMDVEGTSSATVRVKGTFTGTLTFLGGVTPSDVVGARMLMQTGVGSIAVNSLEVDGPIDREFRVVTGGTTFVVEASNWSSGGVSIEAFATEDPSIVFINGPVQNSDEQAARAGRAFLSSTGGQSVTANQELYIIWENPSDSGKIYILTERLFSALSSDEVEYLAYGNPTATLSNSLPAINRYIGNASTSDAEVSYEVADVGDITMGGVTGSGEAIPNDGIPRERKLVAIIPPGQSIGFSIRGAGNNISQASRLFITLQWYEEDTYS